MKQRAFFIRTIGSLVLAIEIVSTRYEVGTRRMILPARCKS